MTADEMHLAVRTQFESVAAFTLDNFLGPEIDIYLNRTIRNYVNQQRTVLLSPEESAASKEANENLRTLIKDDQISSTSSLTGYGNAVSVALSDLSSDFDYHIAARIKEVDGPVYNARKMSPDQWQEKVETAYNEPLFRRPGVLLDSEQIRIVLPVDFGSVEWVQEMYLTPPQQVDKDTSTTSDLPDHTHQDIVDQTVQLMLRDLGNDNAISQQQMQQTEAA